LRSHLWKGWGEEDNAIREAAVAGVINIDGGKALRVFKERGLVDDGSSIVRKAVIELAGQVGKEEDIGWLAKKIGSDEDGELAYQAVSEILVRQKAATVAEWAQKLSWGAESEGRVRDLLEMAEDKAAGEKAEDVLLAVREALLEIYLDSGDAEKVGRLMAARLREKDLGGEDSLVAQIDGHLDSQEVEEEAKATLVGILEGIEIENEESPRPKWAEQVEIWRQKL